MNVFTSQVFISDFNNTARQYKTSSNLLQINVVEVWNVATFITINLL